MTSHVGMSASDLALLRSFLRDDVVCYFIRKADIISGGELIVLSNEAVVHIINFLQRQASRLGRKFFELSFQQKKELIDELLGSEQLSLMRR